MLLNNCRLFTLLALIMLISASCVPMLMPDMAPPAADQAVDNLPTGVYKISTADQTSLTIKFKFNYETRAFTIMEVLQGKKPTKEAMSALFKENYRKMEQSGLDVEDWIQIPVKGAAACIHCEDIQAGDVSVYMLPPALFVGGSMASSPSSWNTDGSKIVRDRRGKPVRLPSKTNYMTDNEKIIAVKIDKLLTKKLNDMIAAGQNNPKLMQQFLRDFPNHPRASALRAELIAKCRSMGTFEGALIAYELTAAIEDAKLMNGLAKTPEDMRCLERVALKLTKDKSRLFSLQLKMDNSGVKQSSQAGFLFVVSKNASVKDITGQATLALRKDSPVKLKNGPYDVTVRFGVRAKKHVVRVSNVLGNLDEIQDEKDPTSTVVGTKSFLSHANLLKIL